MSERSENKEESGKEHIYAEFEKQIKYYTLFRVLRWEFASV